MTAQTTEEEILRLSGPLNSRHSENLAEILREHLQTSTHSPVRIDLSQVTDIDIATLQILVAAKRMAEQSGKKLHLLSLNESIRNRFRLAGLAFLCSP